MRTRRISKEEHQRSTERSYALLHPHQHYGVGLNELVRAIVHCDLWEAEALAISEGFPHFKKRMYDEFSRRRLERHNLKNMDS